MNQYIFKKKKKQESDEQKRTRAQGRR